MKYPVKVWLMTLLGGPAALIICHAIDMETFMLSAIDLFCIMIIVGFFLSLPSLALFWLLFDELEEREIKTYMKKTALALSGLFFIWTTFAILHGRILISADWKNDLIWPVSYSIPLFVFAFVCKLSKAKTQSSPEEINDIDEPTTLYTHD